MSVAALGEQLVSGNVKAGGWIQTRITYYKMLQCFARPIQKTVFPSTPTRISIPSFMSWGCASLGLVCMQDVRDKKSKAANLAKLCAIGVFIAAFFTGVICLDEEANPY
ncbi:MAG: hypothetical protein PHG89_02830 [Gallionella sp.]|nr:hypothetical protein [Gallionella sp.]